MGQMYIINKIGYEYNDQINERSDEYDSGTPFLIFHDAQNAQDKCGELNAREFDGLCIGHYAYGTETLFHKHGSVEEFMSDVLDLTGKEMYSHWECMIPTGIPLEQLKVIASWVDLKFYKVVNVETGD